MNLWLVQRVLQGFLYASDPEPRNDYVKVKEATA